MAAKKTKKPLGRVGRVEQEHRYTQIVRISTIAIVSIVLLVTIFGVVKETLIVPSQPIANVDGVEISTADFQKRVRMERDRLINEYNMYLQLYSSVTDANYQQQYLVYLQQIEAQLEKDTVGQYVLNQMVDEIFIVREAQARGFTVTDDEVTEYFYNVFGYYPNGVPTSTAAPTAIPTSTLSATQYAMITATPLPTVDPEAASEEETAPTEVAPSEEVLPTSVPFEDYQTSLNSYLDRMKPYKIDEAFVRDLIRIQIYRDKLTADLTEGMSLTEDQVWARHILVEDLDTANMLLDELADGADWGELAAANSLDTSNAANGGDLGWFNYDAMVTEFADAAFNGEVGQIVGPVETSYGYHLIQIIGHEQQPADSYTIYQQTNAALTDLLNGLKENATVEFVDNWMSRIPDKPSIPAVTSSLQQQP